MSAPYSANIWGGTEKAQYSRSGAVASESAEIEEVLRKQRSSGSDRYLVSEPAYRFDLDLGDVVHQFSSQAGHDEIDAGRIDIFFLGPRVTDQLISCHRCVQLPEQTFEQQELAPCDGEPAHAEYQFSGGGVERKTTERDRSRPGARIGGAGASAADSLQRL
jgi:hypothetical protein